MVPPPLCRPVARPESVWEASGKAAPPHVKIIEIPRLSVGETDLNRYWKTAEKMRVPLFCGCCLLEISLQSGHEYGAHTLVPYNSKMSHVLDLKKLQPADYILVPYCLYCTVQSVLCCADCRVWSPQKAMHAVGLTSTRRGDCTASAVITRGVEVPSTANACALVAVHTQQ